MKVTRRGESLNQHYMEHYQTHTLVILAKILFYWPPSAAGNKSNWKELKQNQEEEKRTQICQQTRSTAPSLNLDGWRREPENERENPYKPPHFIFLTYDGNTAEQTSLSRTVKPPYPHAHRKILSLPQNLFWKYEDLGGILILPFK